MRERLIVKTINALFYGLFLITPFLIYPYTSEIFEFNKMVFVYFMTTLISASWLIRMIMRRKIIFRKTYLNVPIFIFLATQSISTLISTNPRTSFFGYYSRFHGGLLSTISYSLLYFSYVSNMGKKSTIKNFKAIFISASIISIWASLEHFGRSFSCLIFPEFGTFDVSCWVQDVQNRVYATLGQPNWLAAWISALTPLTWFFLLKSKFEVKNKKLWIYLILNSLFFVTLLFTKSRSGILALIISYILFWGLSVIKPLKKKIKVKKTIMAFCLSSVIYLLFTVLIGTPWTPKLIELFSQKPTINNQQLTGNSAPALETGEIIPKGGTESGGIRRIVWSGALEIWKNYPIFGSGLETFAYSYYNFRPVEHNLVSEWDFLYNKAHNEYLNTLATTGTVGAISYLILIIFSISQIINFNFSERKPIFKKFSLSSLSEVKPINLALLTGYISILITNFFGFSVVMIGLMLFLIPAFAFSLTKMDAVESKEIALNNSQKVLMLTVSFLALYFLNKTINYWSTDKLYAKGKLYNDSNDYVTGATIMSEVIKKSPKEAIYWDELARSETYLSILYSQNERPDEAGALASKALSDSNIAISLSPANVNLKRSYSANLITLSVIDPNFMFIAKDVLENAIKQAPTDAKLYYNLGLIYLRTNDIDKAKETLIKTIEMKNNYEKAHHALALLYSDLGEKDKAKEEYEYILKFISPENENVKRELNELGI